MPKKGTRSTAAPGLGGRVTRLEGRVDSLEHRVDGIDGGKARKREPAEPAAPKGPRCPGCRLEIASRRARACEWCGFVLSEAL